MEAVLCVLYGHIIGAVIAGVADNRIDDASQDYAFSFEDTKYVVVVRKKGMVDEADQFCQKSLGGNLVTLDSPEEMREVINGVGLYFKSKRDSVNEMWLGGRSTASVHDVFNMSSYTTDTSSGQCVILSDWESSAPRLFAKECRDAGRKFLCEVSSFPRYLYYYAETSDGCPKNTRSASAYIAMTSKNCTQLKGSYKGSTMPHHVVNCYFDWCGTNSTSVTGVVPAVPGRCISDTVASGSVRAYGSYCKKMGGRPMKWAGPWKWTNCQFDWCRPKETNRDTYVVSAPSRCPDNSRVSEGIIYMKASDCKRIGGFSYGKPKMWSWVGCTLEFCRLGKDCKKTTLGKDYTGTMSKTLSGRTCQRWDSQTPHPHANTNSDWFPEDTVKDAANYCRNPADWAEGPFCFTTDPEVQWELCELPLCEGIGPNNIDFRIGDSRYILVPALHTDPDGYCAKAHGMSLATVDSLSMLAALNAVLVPLKKRHRLAKMREIWIGGRTDIEHGEEISSMQDIGSGGNSGQCLVLSEWNVTSQAFDRDDLVLFAQTCQRYRRYFLCQAYDVRITGMLLDGGVEQAGIDDIDACWKSCAGKCRSADFVTSDRPRCWHHFEGSCRPGYAAPSGSTSVHMQRERCECNRPLVSGLDGLPDEALSASSVQSRNGYIHAVARGRIDTMQEVKPTGVLSGAWVPAKSDMHQWIGVDLGVRREVYAVITQGRDAVVLRQWVTAYRFNYSTDCLNWDTYKERGKVKVFVGNTNQNETKLQVFKRVLYIQCARILPVTWSQHIALRFELIGCLRHRVNVALGQETFQSSIYSGTTGPSSHAVDGLLYTTYNPQNSCTHTRKQTNPWWAVDIGQVFDVTDIEITNRGDCCEKRLHDFTVKIGYGFSKVRFDTADYETCAEVTGHVGPGASMSVACRAPIPGRFVVVQISGKAAILTLCEVRVFATPANVTNVALGKKSFQSTTGSGIASKAVDGNTNTFFFTSGCSHTVAESDPWWQVDLAADYSVQEVLLTNRGDCCASRLHDVIIEVSSHPTKILHATGSRTCAVVPGSFQLGETRHIRCRSGVTGRFVKVTVPGTDEILTLCEVQVYGVRELTRTYGGNGGHAECVFPFTFNETVYSGCVTVGREGRPWCAVTDDYDNDGVWGFCVDVRLVGGRLDNEGRVEVRREGVWGSVCDDGWDDTDVNVLCRQLGYKGGKAVYPPTFGRGVGAILLDDVGCGGNETSLTECSYVASGAHDCSHSEDAGAICKTDENSGGSMVGYPAYRRSQKDDLLAGIVLLQNCEVTHEGIVTSWTVYIGSQETAFELQIWRPTTNQVTFMLVSSLTVSGRSPGVHTIDLPEADRTLVNVGDVIGLSFPVANPVPFDYSFYCEHHRTLYRRLASAAGKINAGEELPFRSKTDSTDSCRVYSVYANVRTAEQRSLGDFSYKTSLYLVREETTDRRSAENLCRLHLGDTARLVHLETTAEYMAVQQHLAGLAGAGTYWIGGRTDTVASSDNDVILWGKCQPERGKSCLVLAKEADDATEYVWYTRTCSDSYKFICENNHTADRVTVAPSTAVSQHIRERSTSGVARRWLIGVFTCLVCIVIVVATILLYLRWRRRRGSCVLQNRFIPKSMPFLHSTFGIGNPLYADNSDDDDGGTDMSSDTDPRWSADNSGQQEL